MTSESDWSDRCHGLTNDLPGGTIRRVFIRHRNFIPGRQRLSVLIGLILLSLVLTQLVELPTRTFAVSVFGSPLGVDLSSQWLMAILLAGLACTGTDLLVRAHPNARQESLSLTVVYWVLPGLLGLAAAQLLAQAPTRQIWAAGLAATGLVFGIVITAEYTIVDPLAPAYPQARLLLNTVAYALAFTLFVLLYQTRARSLVTVSAMLIISFALALDLLWNVNVPANRKALLAGIVGLIMGECSWAMNYWPASAWSSGILLLLIFYVTTGIAHQHLQARLSRSVLVEFAVVIVVGLGILIAFHP